MQSTKSRSGSLSVPQKTPRATPRTERKLQTRGSDSDPLSSPSPVRKIPKDRSSNVVDRRSPRSPASEKKKPNKVSELESQLVHLQDELKKAKDQLSSSESCTKKSQQAADEAQSRLTAALAELEKTQNQLNELSYSEDSRIQELRKISQDRDKSWESELQAVQKQHSMDSVALSLSLNEIQRLKIQLNKISDAEASQARHAESAHAEIHGLRVELTETLDLVEKLKSQLSDSRESEEHALEETGRIQVILEIMKSTEENLKSENGKVKESYNSLLAELEESNNKVKYLEELVRKFQTQNEELEESNDKVKYLEELVRKFQTQNEESEKLENMESEINDLKNEASKLRDELEDAKIRNENEHQEMTLQLKDANDLVEIAKIESRDREAELESKVNESTSEIEELKVKLMGKENELLNELSNAKTVLDDLKADLLDKEMHLQSVIQENETLKSEVLKKDVEKGEEKREALMKLGNVTEEADKSSRKAVWLTEQLEAAQAASSEMEAELKRLKVQSDQWRKAAEAAATMLSAGNNNSSNNVKYVEKIGNLETTIGGRMGSPFSDEELSVKKNGNGNVLKKIGVLLKKGQR